MQASHMAPHAHLETAGVLPNTICQVTIHTIDRHAETADAHLIDMFRDTEYFSFGSGDVLATFGVDEHRKCNAFIKKTETTVFFS